MSKKIILIVLCLLFVACTPVVETLAPTEKPKDIQETQPTATETPTQMPATNTPTMTPTQRSTSTPWPEPTGGPTPIGGSERILFGLVERQAESYQGAGVFLFDPISMNKMEVFGAGYRLQSASPDGHNLLVNDGQNLYLSGLYGEAPILISDQFENNAGKTALWSADGETIFWIEKKENQTLLMMAELTNVFNAKPLNWLPHQAIQLFSFLSNNQLVWKAGNCSDQTNCGNGFWITDLNSQLSQPVQYLNSPEFASNGAFFLALAQGEENTELNVYGSSDLAPIETIVLKDDYPADYVFSNGGEKAAVLAQIRSDYSGKNFGNRVIELNSSDWKALEIGKVDGLNAAIAWSPDDNYLIAMITLVTDNGYQIGVERVNTLNNQIESFTESIALESSDYIFVSGVFWLP